MKIQKQDQKFLARQYEIPKHQLLKLPRKAAIKARKKIAESIKLCRVDANKIKVPTHAFDSSTETDDEDYLFETTIIISHDNDALVDTESNKSTSTNCPESTSSSHASDPVMCSSVEETSFSSTGCTHDHIECEQRFLSINAIIQETRVFLTGHPTPPSMPTNLRRSRRIKQEPKRYEPKSLDRREDMVVITHWINSNIHLYSVQCHDHTYACNYLLLQVQVYVNFR